ncbi:unnamed protein product [Paramecium primaurelia]|uniref:Uncharacterized protein n=1 Tax=Paramecium primaurelia TaxID=5886 RepID=A0A8S1LSW0_PARPR|nr:unnamed protein product [Paramecium primaurelia]
MDQIYECLMKMQSYFSNPHSQFEPQIESCLTELKTHFKNMETWDSESPNIQLYFDRLQELWFNFKKKKNTSPQNLQWAQQQLKEIISEYNEIENYQSSDQKSENIHLKNEVNMLKMQLDCMQRKQQKERIDTQHFQRAAEELKNKNQTIKKLQKEVQRLEEKRQEDLKRHQETIQNIKKNQMQNKPFDVKQLEEENMRLKSMNIELMQDVQNLKEQLKGKDFLIQDTRELEKYKELVQKQQTENRSLEEQISQLYDKLNLGKQNEMENEIAQLETKLKQQTNLLQKTNDDNKNLQKRIEQLKQQNQKLIQKTLEPLGIRILPEIKGVQSHFNAVMHLLEAITPFSTVLTVTDKVSSIILKFITYIRKEAEQFSPQTAISLQELLRIELQNDNRANDFLFQIIDHLSKAIIKQDEQKSQIASIIQTQDSPIYDQFFFLQRVFPMDLEIQQNEVPLINSIKHIRYFEAIIQPGVEFFTYLQGLIKLEGQENIIDDNVGDFNFLIFPQYLILNVCELSLQKADIKISFKLPSSCLNQNVQDFEYSLISIVHCSDGLDGQPTYSITLCKNNNWVQIQNDNATSISINDILTFKQPYNDKELLIYKRTKK